MSNFGKQPLTPESATNAPPNDNIVSSGTKESEKHDNDQHLKLEPFDTENAVDAQKTLLDRSPEESGEHSHGLTPYDPIDENPSTSLTISDQVKKKDKRTNALRNHLLTLGVQGTLSLAAGRRGSLCTKGTSDKHPAKFQRARACSVGQLRDTFIAGTRQRLLSKSYELPWLFNSGLSRRKRHVLRSRQQRGDREGSKLFYRMTSSADMLSSLSFDGRGKGIELRSIACQTDVTGRAGDVLPNVVEREDEDEQVQEDSNLTEEGSNSSLSQLPEITTTGSTEDIDNTCNDEDYSDCQESTSVYSDDETASTCSHRGLPSIGPPNIVRYHRESEWRNIASESVQLRVQSAVQTTSSSEQCPYCGKQLLPSLAVDEPSTLGLCKQFCCEDYEKFVKLHLARSDGACIMQDELINIMPSEHYGSKAARRAARERALERLRERELEKMRKMSEQPTYVQFSRPTKTIQYALSSVKYMKNGWTIRPRTADPEKENDVSSFEIDVNTTFLQKTKAFYHRLYDDGNTFLIVFPDGSGACYYPSGNFAVIITTTESGKYSYLVFKNTSNPEYPDSGLLGVFEPNGCGCCYFPEGSIRLVLNAYGGTQSDRKGSRRKKWQWNSENWHTHAPPLHPICFSLNKNIAVRVKDQDDIVLTFTCASRSVRFNVGAKIKILKSPAPKIRESDEHLAYLRSFKETTGELFSKIEMALRFPNSPRLEKLSLRPHIKGQRKSRRATAALPTIEDSEHTVVVN